jgi:lysophospholipase L1-like esterase
MSKCSVAVCVALGVAVLLGCMILLKTNALRNLPARIQLQVPSSAGATTTATCSCSSPVSHESIRKNIIELEITQIIGQRSYLVVGDSIVEAAVLEPICGAKPINAGIGGGQIQTFLGSLSKWVAKAKPLAVVIAGGVNNSRVGANEPPRAFGTDYAQLAEEARQSGADVILASITPVAKGMELGDKYFDPTAIDSFNKEIAAIARRLNFDFLDLHASMSRGSNLQPSLTDDGVARFTARLLGHYGAFNDGRACSRQQEFMKWRPFLSRG